MNNVRSALSLIGGTPMILAERFSHSEKIRASIFAKLENKNPFGSVKDRAALAMVRAAEARGELSFGGTIIEPTSGNTGISLSAIAAICGYSAVIVMPEGMSNERAAIMRAYGARVVYTERALGMSGAIATARELKEKTPGAFIPSQFDNPDNPKAHYETTGPEIWEQSDGEVDIFVAGVGTGGTVSGTGRYLKEKNPRIKIVAVEPYDSPVLSGGEAAAHGIQGIGAGFVPKNLNRSIIDEVITVKLDEAYRASRLLARTEGVLVGISSGAVLSAAVKLAKRSENTVAKIIALLADGGERYLSCGLF